jgi:hypothetical protein
MIICYLHVVCIPAPPLEANSPLIVYANAVLSPSVSRQLFEPIRWRYPQVLQNLSGIQYLKLSSRYPLDILWEFPRKLTIEQLFRFLGRETLDHHPNDNALR